MPPAIASSIAPYKGTTSVKSRLWMVTKTGLLTRGQATPAKSSSTLLVDSTKQFYPQICTQQLVGIFAIVAA